MPKCEHCQAEFPPSKYSPRKRYCSESCGKKAFMKKYNQTGKVRKNLGKRICGGCLKETADLAKNDTYGMLCMVCRNNLKDGKLPATNLYTEVGSKLHGRDWWIGRRFGKFEVVNIPSDVLYYGQGIETRVTVKCQRGHLSEMEVRQLGGNCAQCTKDSEDKQAIFEVVDIPPLASFNDWKKWLEEFTDIKLLSSPEEYWSKGKAVRAKLQCWCGRIWEPRWNDVTSKRIVSCGCVNRSSKPVDQIIEHIEDLGFTVEREKPFEEFQADIFVKEKNLVIEFDGLYWHSKDINDFRKYNTYMKYCHDYMGIYEDEWDYSHEQVFKMLDERLIEYKVPPPETQMYMEEENNWISYQLGNKDGILASIDIEAGNEITDFTRTYIWDKILMKQLWQSILEVNSSKTFSIVLDNRKNDRWIFEELGFKKIRDIEPKTWWVNGSTRTDKSMEDQEGWHKLRDCGHRLYGYQI